MTEKIKKKQIDLTDQPDFNETDQRLECGWYTQIEGSGQRKRYLRSIKEKININQPAK